MRSRMRMPLLSYFVVVGSVLLAAIVWLGDTLEPVPPPIAVSHTVGLPAPYKAPIEIALAPAIAEPVVAMAVPMPAARPAKAIKVAAVAPKQTKKVATPLPRSRLAEYPHGPFNFR